ncbi:MAG: NAD-dependent epimerase/dehydratase family protein [Gammaproteobacteria bacterium]|nr:NAD-dependent epimerase/dehydratase family protein [Gammaproteobacteria bacterium]
MKTLVIGGTGFLGGHIVDALLAAGHNVAVLSRNKARSAAVVADSVGIIEGDLAQLDQSSLTKILSGFDGLVYAAGVDERVRPDTDAREFYFRENVETCRKVLCAARDTRISHVVVLNSIFTCVNRLQPELELTEHHPYIASRVAQSEMVIAVSEGHFVASVLEIPWVFGDTKGKPSQWAALVNYVRYTRRMLAPNGGAVAISAENVGRVTLGALSQPTVSASMPIGDCQLSWDEMLLQLAKLSGKSDNSVTRLPDSIFAGLTRLGALTMRLVGEKSGLDFSRLDDLLTKNIDVDLSASQELLNYGQPDMESALAATVASVPDYRRASTWSRWAQFKTASTA